MAGSGGLPNEGAAPPGVCRFFTSLHDGEWRGLGKRGGDEKECGREEANGAQIFEIGFCKNGTGPW
jgi:hypothetical protein